MAIPSFLELAEVAKSFSVLGEVAEVAKSFSVLGKEMS